MPVTNCTVWFRFRLTKSSGASEQMCRAKLCRDILSRNVEAQKVGTFRTSQEQLGAVCQASQTFDVNQDVKSDAGLTNCASRCEHKISSLLVPGQFRSIRRISARGTGSLTELYSQHLPSFGRGTRTRREGRAAAVHRARTPHGTDDAGELN